MKKKNKVKENYIRSPMRALFYQGQKREGLNKICPYRSSPSHEFVRISMKY